MEIKCTEEEKELLIVKLAGNIGCPGECVVRTLHGCDECVTNQMGIRWIIEIPIKRKD